jgi:hypothetical protein
LFSRVLSCARPPNTRSRRWESGIWQLCRIAASRPGGTVFGRDTSAQSVTKPFRLVGVERACRMDAVRRLLAASQCWPRSRGTRAQPREQVRDRCRVLVGIGDVVLAHRGWRWWPAGVGRGGIVLPWQSGDSGPLGEYLMQQQARPGVVTDRMMLGWRLSHRWNPCRTSSSFATPNPSMKLRTRAYLGRPANMPDRGPASSSSSSHVPGTARLCRTC